MEYVLISLVAFFTSILTFFSGFGLGTILTPAFAFFFPIETAIALTGIVHFFNNIFKLFLVGMHANRAVLFRFGIPALIASFVGALLLVKIADLPAIVNYSLFEKEFEVTPVKLIIATILIIFAWIDLIPFFDRFEIKENMLPFGGILSGFFGGLSGNQGALRSAFLIKLGLSKEAFIGSAVVISCFVDFTRIGVYATRFESSGLIQNIGIVAAATISAISGAILGRYLLTKVTIGFVQKVVAIMLMIVSLALGLGLL